MHVHGGTFKSASFVATFKIIVTTHTSIVFTTLEGHEAKCSVVIEMTIIRTTKIRYEDDNTDNYNLKKLQQYP